MPNFALVKPDLHIVVTIAQYACYRVLIKPRLQIVVMVVRIVANMFLTVSSNFDTREHFDYNIANFAGIVINC